MYTVADQPMLPGTGPSYDEITAPKKPSTFDPGPRFMRGSARAGQLAMGFDRKGELWAGYNASGNQVGPGPLEVSNPLGVFGSSSVLSTGLGPTPRARQHPDYDEDLWDVGGRWHGYENVNRKWDNATVKNIGPDAQMIRGQADLRGFHGVGDEAAPGDVPRPAGGARTLEQMRHVPAFSGQHHRGMQMEGGDSLPWLVQFTDEGRGRMNPATGEYEQGGMLMAVDGNHRATASRFRGDGSFAARVMDFREALK